jgi:hypothetical protein
LLWKLGWEGCLKKEFSLMRMGPRFGCWAGEAGVYTSDCLLIFLMSFVTIFFFYSFILFIGEMPFWFSDCSSPIAAWLISANSYCGGGGGSTAWVCCDCLLIIIFF